MDSKTIVMCVVALLLGMLLANMLKSVCGCKTVEGNITCDPSSSDCEGRGDSGIECSDFIKYCEANGDVKQDGDTWTQNNICTPNKTNDCGNCSKICTWQSGN